MEPITLVATAITLAMPFLIKSGEKIAEQVGEDIWKTLKKPFSKDEETLKKEFNSTTDRKSIEEQILAKLKSDPSFKIELEEAVTKGKEKIASHNQQNIHNHGHIEKQVNIQNVDGNVNL